MRRSLLRLCLVLCVAPALGAKAPAAPSHDGRPNTYRLAIADDARSAFVDADLWLESDLLSLFNVSPVDGLPNGQADLVEELRVVDTEGRVLVPKSLGQGDFEVGGGRRVRASYRVRLEHDRYAWPAGAEEVSYRTDEGLLATGATLFLADGGDRMVGPFEVEIALPAGWRAVTPWPRSADGLRFAPASRRELLSNALFFGTAATESVTVGGVELTLLLGRRYLPAKALFADLLRTQLESYRALFGADPAARRFLVVVNQGDTGDGGAFASSFSQLIQGDADEGNRVIWGYVMAHELFHFWNGLSLVPADDREEWFKEGATDYLTTATLARNGLIDESVLLKRLESAVLRTVLARRLQGLDLSVRDSGREKQKNRLLVYGGGALASLALDVELRKASGGAVGLPQFMARLFAERGQPGQTYALDDLERVARELTGRDFAPFFARAVESPEWFDIAPALADVGLRLDSFVEEIYVRRDPKATPEQRARFAAIFGAPR